MSLRARSGRWHYRFMANGKTWTGDTGLPATERNKRNAQSVESGVWNRVKLARPELQIQAVRFTEAAAQFLEWAKGQDKPNTYKRASGSFSSLTCYFGSKILTSITAGQVCDFVSHRRSADKVKDVTIRHDLHNLSRFFRYAIKHNWAETNPVLSEDIPSDANAVRINPLDAKTEAWYFARAAKYPRLYDLTRLMLLQGCRPEEILALKVQHLHLERGKFRIIAGKTATARRELAMRQESREIFSRLVHEAQGEWLFASIRDPRKKLSLSTCENWHTRVDTEDSCVIYDFRHTYATRAAAVGMALCTLAAILGHSGIRSVMKYIHVQQADMDREIRQQDAVVDPAPCVETSLRCCAV